MDVGCCMESWSGQQCYCSCTVHVHLVDPTVVSACPRLQQSWGNCTCPTLTQPRAEPGTLLKGYKHACRTTAVGRDGPSLSDSAVVLQYLAREHYVFLRLLLTCPCCRLLVEEQSLMQARAGQESLLATLTDASSYGSS
jgi:hypothetical protein